VPKVLRLARVGPGPRRVVVESSAGEREERPVHDFTPDERQVPPRIAAAGPRDHFEALTWAVAQAGLHHRVILRRWADYDDALAGFDPRAVAAFGPDEVAALHADERLIRHAAKLSAVVENARRLVALEAQPGGFAGWLERLGAYEDQVAGLCEAFVRLGPHGATWLLHVLGHRVPDTYAWDRLTAAREARRASAEEGAESPARSGASPRAADAASPGE
jgi:3-methyladenine DNA glycosylase Tag